MKNILVVGANPVGLEVMRQLRAKKQQVRLVDDYNADVEFARLQGFEVEQINLQNDADLKRLGIGQQIDVLFALLDNDANNVFLVISARFLAPQIEIVSIGGTADTISRLYAAGADKVIDPFKISGFKIFEHMNRPLIAETLEKTVFGKSNLEIAEIRVPAQSFLTGRSLQNIAWQDRFNLVVLGIVDQQQKDHLIFVTDPQKHRIRSGDILVVIGPQNEIESLQKALSN